MTHSIGSRREVDFRHSFENVEPISELSITANEVLFVARVKSSLTH